MVHPSPYGHTQQQESGRLQLLIPVCLPKLERASSPTLLAVLLRFREHSTAISSDIRGMFHQVRLLPVDKPLLRFLWRDIALEQAPDVYQWQVLPFGTTCSPCCATFALQKHVLDHSQPGDQVREVIEKYFYVDNCLHSLTSKEAAKCLVDQLCALLN